MVLWQSPSERSHAHFAEREHEPIPGISISRILGVESHTKIPSMEFETRDQNGRAEMFCTTEGSISQGASRGDQPSFRFFLLLCHHTTSAPFNIFAFWFFFVGCESTLLAHQVQQERVQMEVQ